MPYPIYSKTSPDPISELTTMMSSPVSGAGRVSPGPGCRRSVTQSHLNGAFEP